MKITKILVAFLVLSMSFTACNKKNKGNDTNKNIKKVEKKKTVKKEVKKKEKVLAVKKTKATTEQINKLSEIFAFGDKLIKERKVYQNQISVLSRDFKGLKNPFKIKSKFVSYSYFSDSVWVTVYPDAKTQKARKNYLFWITISYKHSIDDRGRKSYREKFAGYNAMHFKDAWVWILLKDDIEIKISPYTKKVKSDKEMAKILKKFNTKGMEHIFDKKTKYPKLKEYFLKIKAINAKINAVNKKFKDKEKEAIIALKPFITKEGILKDLNLDQIFFSNSNTFSIYVKKDKRAVFSLYIGRPGALGLLMYFNNKNLKHSKIDRFDVTSLKDNLVMTKLPTLAVKATTYAKTEFKNAKKLKEAIFSLDIDGLSKVK